MEDEELQGLKTKTMAFKRKCGVRSKIVVNGKIIAQVSNFKYLECKISILNAQEYINQTNKCS
jgi:hypothetical protein